MVAKPAPLVPTHVDLTDFAFMPLDVRRVRDSRFSASAEPECFRAGLLLWCASWHQVPAASLPNDDIELSNLAGYGRVIKEWRKVKDGALYGWIECSDGRLYHPVIAEKAREAWRSKLEHSYDREVDRIRKANKRRAEDKHPTLPIPTFEEWEIQRMSAGIPPDSGGTSAGTSDGNPAENALKGQGEVRDRDKRSSLRSDLRARERPPESTGSPPDNPVEADLDPRNREAFERIRTGYPPGVYPASDWLIGEREVCRRVEEGERWSEIEAGVIRYRDQVIARGKLGREGVYSPKNFFAPRERRWRDEWPLPRAKEEPKRWEPPPDEAGAA